MPTAVKLNTIPQWQHLSRIKHCPPTSDSSITVKDEYSCILLGPTRLYLSHTLSLFFSYISFQSLSGSQFSVKSELTNTWPCLQMKPEKNCQPPLLGTSQISKFNEPPLMMNPL
jgi:hypothetical protein